MNNPGRIAGLRSAALPLSCRVGDIVNGYLAELLALTAQTWKGRTLATGLTAGFFSAITSHTPVSLPDLARSQGYDLDKLKAWLRFAHSLGLVSIGAHGVTLTAKGFLLSPDSPCRAVVAQLPW
jgi:hypothetical protein